MMVYVPEEGKVAVDHSAKELIFAWIKLNSAHSGIVGQINLDDAARGRIGAVVAVDAALHAHLNGTFTGLKKEGAQLRRRHLRHIHLQNLTITGTKEYMVIVHQCRRCAGITDW